MNELREWFVLNRPLIFFVYGQVFFIMGIAIVLQSRRYSRLDLARSLPWLAAFGITHAFNEWGDLFIPIQATFLPEPLIQSLHAGLKILLAVSFTCLLQFGVELLRPLPEGWRRLRLLPIALLTVWLIGPFWIGLQASPDPDTARAIAAAAARYLIGFPAGLLSAYSLRRHARLRIAPLGLPRIYTMLRVAGLALAAYAVLSGLIVPPAPFFPASVLNTTWFGEVFVVPPEVCRALAASVLALAMIRALEVFEVETDRMIERMEQAQVIAIERERLGRDLHDGAIQQLYAVGLLAASVRKKVDGSVADSMDRLMTALNDAVAGLRQSISDLRGGDAQADLSTALAAIVDEARRAVGADVQWSADALPPLSPDRMTHIVAFVREAVSNAIRHAQADAIEVSTRRIDNRLRIIVRDDGCGFNLDAPRGYGLRNMRDRARLLGGETSIQSAPGKGTAVTLTFPVERET